jgi:hypothetical protein
VNVSVVAGVLRKRSVPLPPSLFRSTTVPDAGAAFRFSVYDWPVLSTTVSTTPFKLAETIDWFPKSI